MGGTYVWSSYSGKWLDSALDSKLQLAELLRRLERKLLDTSGTLLEGSETLLEASWALLGQSWALLERS